MKSLTQIDSAPRHGLAFVRRLGPEDYGAQQRLVMHDYAAVVLFVGGEAEVESVGPVGSTASWTLQGGDVLVLPAGRSHRILRATEPEAWWVGFCAACLRAAGGSEEALRLLAAIRRGASPAVTLPEERRVFAGRLARELAEETQTAVSEAGHHPRESSTSTLATRSLLTLLLLELQRARDREAGRPEGVLAPPVAEALTYVEQHGLEPISLKDVAAAVGRSPAHMTTAVREATGRPVGEWITAVRMAEARRRLLRTDELVDEVARAVGYADATHFIRLFRRSCGATPGKWRTLHRG